MPIDGYSQVFNRQDNTGSAFILGKNEAIEPLKEHVKTVLADLGKHRIKQQQILNSIGNIPMKGALDSDIYNYILPAKKQLQDNVAGLSQKLYADPNYINSPAGRQHALEVQQQKNDYEAMVASSMNRKAIYDRELAAYDANPDAHEEEALLNLAKYKQANPLSADGTGNLVLPKKFDYAKFLQTGEKLIPDNVVETPSEGGLISTTKKNKMYEGGNPTTYFKEVVQPKVESFLTTPDGQRAIKEKRKELKLSDDDAGNQKAADAVRQDLYTSKDQEFKQTQKQPPESEKKKTWTASGNSYHNDSNIWHYDRNDNGEIFTMSHTDSSENKELNFKVFDKDGHVEEIKAVPTRIEYPKGATQPIIYANQTVKEVDPEDPTKKITKIVERQVPYEFNAAKIENEFGKSPYDVRLAVTGSIDQNGSVKTGKAGGGSVQKLTGKINPITLKKGQQYEVEGKVYTWNGKNLVE